jgi:hypothetical protein
MNWPTLITSVISAVIVAALAAWLNPLFQHRFGKKQKLREQRLSIAERFAGSHAKNLLPPQSTADLLTFIEANAFLVLVPVLFERQETLAASNRLHRWQMDRSLANLSVDEFKYWWALRIDLLTRLFAEAFEIDTNEITRRSARV